MCAAVARRTCSPDLPDTTSRCTLTSPVRAQVKEVCTLVTRRSARLIAAALCGILRHLHRDRVPPDGEEGGPAAPLGATGRSPPRTCVAVDGGIFVRYGFYRELLRQGVRDILGDAVADRVRPTPLLRCTSSSAPSTC